MKLYQSPILTHLDPEVLRGLTILEHDQEFFDMYHSGELLNMFDLTAPLPPSLEMDAPRWAPFLTDGDMADYGHYVSHLNDHYAPGTIREYRQCINNWRTLLEYDVSMPQINAALRKQRSVARHKSMLAALRSYARYRHELGDSRLYAMIALSKTIMKPKERYYVRKTR